MRGFCGVIGRQLKLTSKQDILRSINLADTLSVESFSNKGYFVGLSYLPGGPLQGDFFIK